jgi:hypothetical protein
MNTYSDSYNLAYQGINTQTSTFCFFLFLTLTATFLMGILHKLNNIMHNDPAVFCDGTAGSDNETVPCQTFAQVTSRTKQEEDKEDFRGLSECIYLGYVLCYTIPRRSRANPVTVSAITG